MGNVVGGLRKREKETEREREREREREKEGGREGRREIIGTMSIMDAPWPATRLGEFISLIAAVRRHYIRLATQLSTADLSGGPTEDNNACNALGIQEEGFVIPPWSRRFVGTLYSLASRSVPQQ